jgi:hypothetical protein
MAHFRVVHVRKSRDVKEEGWAVERSALGEKAGIVSRLFPSRADAKAEADRLAAREAKETGK